MSQPLKVTIVGAGLVGLACGIACRRQGFEVFIVDQLKEFLRLGDSIGFGSNSARLLYRWGVGSRMEPIASQSSEMRIYNFDSSDKLLGVDDQIGKSRVEVYDPNKPSITLSSGEEIQSDVVIIADGVRSKGRRTVLGYEDKPQASGYVIYRSFMSGDLLRDDPLISKFLSDGDTIRLFLAKDMHGFISTLQGGKEINAVLTHKDVGDVAESWTKEASKEDVPACLEGWEPTFRRVWEKMPSVIDWKLVYRPCLDKWVADSGLVALMDDAAHPFLPTSTQGASQAIEDGATIAKCLSKFAAGDIPLALHTYFEIRHEYVAEAQATGIKQREIWHNLHDEDSKAFKEEFDINSTMMQNLYL
ncbi:hypothetical protein BDP81DRAFT_466758 [Colletotrichum phormii]|uniref:FAD-binding domain-containing protein n=1 Tax=Colletotrichum phormii TaxID=359342 RepID=A0AAI9ZBX7_9PEZI|nr:uncharacterized protein BDP81DRAFT_466758 [Colletotrichum phormii]KAK1621457.1 hypothetical protein BDP81DRAFT_466758 [Colletotrichum phormii]